MERKGRVKGFVFGLRMGEIWACFQPMGLEPVKEARSKVQQRDDTTERNLPLIWVDPGTQRNSGSSELQRNDHKVAAISKLRKRSRKKP